MNKIKFILLGSFYVGKTAIINQLIENRFSEIYMMAPGYDKSLWEIEISNTKMKLDMGYSRR